MRSFMLKQVLRGHPQPGSLRNQEAAKFFSQDFAAKVIEAFLSADIFLYKLSNPELKKLFASLGQPLPSKKLAAEGRSTTFLLLNWSV